MQQQGTRHLKQFLFNDVFSSVISQLFMEDEKKVIKKMQATHDIKYRNDFSNLEIINSRIMYK